MQQRRRFPCCWRAASITQYNLPVRYEIFTNLQRKHLQLQTAQLTLVFPTDQRCHSLVDGVEVGAKRLECRLAPFSEC